MELKGSYGPSFAEFPGSTHAHLDGVPPRIVLPRPLYLSLMRHGETTHNQKNLITGDLDVDLTERGEKQAQASGRHLWGHYDAIFASSLRRSQQTLVLALRHSQCTYDNIFVDRRLNERSLGDLQGRVSRFIPEFADGDLFYRPGGGESYWDVLLRTYGFLYDIQFWAKQRRAERFLICGHAGPLRILRGLIEDESSARNVLSYEIRNSEPQDFVLRSLNWPKFAAQSDKFQGRFQ